MPKPGPRTTYKYSEEFKATAVRLIQLDRLRGQDVAQSLYIHPFMLSRWRKQAREGLIMMKGGVSGGGYEAQLAAGWAHPEHEPTASDDGQRPHGVVEQVDEIGYVSPTDVWQRQVAARCGPFLRRLL